MTQEQKAKAYDEALERAKKWRNAPNIEKIPTFGDRIIEEIFPELKDSEDEKIRKEILDYFQQFENEELRGVSISAWIAWLEKQGEHKSVDKVEPKFHEGEWIIHKELGGDYIHNPHKIIQVDILDKKYRLEGGLVAHFSEQEDYELVEQKPAWSKEDERNIKELLYLVEANYLSWEEPHGRLMNFLKSIKPQTWKPSEEMLEALYRVIPENVMEKSEDDMLLDKLYQGLKYGKVLSEK